jgi:hypothetical protein
VRLLIPYCLLVRSPLSPNVIAPLAARATAANASRAATSVIPASVTQPLLPLHRPLPVPTAEQEATTRRLLHLLIMPMTIRCQLLESNELNSCFGETQQ